MSEESIRLRAYEIWQREGCPDGRAGEHWAVAEAELTGELRLAKRKATRLRTKVAKSDGEAGPPPARKRSARAGTRLP